MANRLAGLVIDEVSFVDRGACQDADVAIYKRRGMAESRPRGTGRGVAQRRLDERGHDVGIEDLLKTLGIDPENEYAKRAIKPFAETIEKRLGELGSDDKIAELQKALDEKDAEIAALSADEPEDEDVMKNLSPEVRARIEEIEKRAEQDRTEREKLQKRLDEEEEVRKRASYVAKAAGLDLPMHTDELGSLLYSFAKHDSEGADKLVELLRKVDAEGKESALFRELGADRGESTDEALGQLSKMAKERVQKANAAGGSLSYEQAYSEVLMEHPELYEKHKNERPERRQS